MKRRHIGFLLCLGALVVQASTVIAPAADFTCQVYGGSFVLDDSDFEALADKKIPSQIITREKFATLAPTSKIRVAICDTRKLWRVVQTGKAHACDFEKHYENWSVVYASPSEGNKLVMAQGKAFAEPIQKCR
jgi:hypothetical protein